MGASTKQKLSNDAIIKIAKKTLTRKESGTMKIKSLAKSVVSTIQSKAAEDPASSYSSQLPDVCKESVRKLIEESQIFKIEGKIVMLKKDLGAKEENNKNIENSSSKKKRKSPDTNGKQGELDTSVDVKANADQRSPKKVSKKAKKSKNLAPSIENVKSNTSNHVSVKEWRQQNKIVLRDPRNGIEGMKASKLLEEDTLYNPFRTFDSIECIKGLAAPLIRQCTEVNGFLKPSPIQAQCWPILLRSNQKGRFQDVVGIAETGSGKTLAFALPALSTMSTHGSPTKDGRSPRMLVLAPTRELVIQSQAVLKEFGKIVDLTSAVIYGGVPKSLQKEALRRGLDCIVCTPGRLKDLVDDGTCRLGNVSHLVLDEADRMLDMGFEEDVRLIISKCQPKERRQTAMFSATWPATIQQLALEYMVNPVCVYVGFDSIVGSNGENAVDDSLSANKRVSQTIEVIEDRAREPRLRELLLKHKNGKRKNDRILVFALYKKEAARLEGNLKRCGFDCASIHGDKPQDARNRALGKFKDGSCPILVATDVAARGLDIPDVEVVINFTFPLTIEDYVHRIGRTGRAGKSGISHTFFQPSDKSHAGELQQVMRQAGQDVPNELMKFGSTIKKKEHKLYGNFGPKSGPMKKAVKITFDSDEE